MHGQQNIKPTIMELVKKCVHLTNAQLTIRNDKKAAATLLLMQSSARQ